MTKLKVGLLFGGCSGEHQVSISSARAIAGSLSEGDNRDRYEVIPVYIQKDGIWQAGETAAQILASDTTNEQQTLRLRSVQATNNEQQTNNKQQTTNNQQPTTNNQQQLWQFPPEVGEVEVWFPILHGPNGEDGTVQGLLKLMQVPFVGSGVLGSSLGMDKIAMKVAFAAAGLSQVKYKTVTRSQVWSNPCVFPKLCDEIEGELSYPCFIKPANLGSSVGISKVRSRSELETALDNAASYDRRIIVEEGVVGREVECAVLGNDNAKASVVGEISFNSDFYDYETKYKTGQAELLIPAPLEDKVVSKIQEMSLQAFAAVDAAGLGRVDFFYVEATGEVLINEINTLPGFTATSMYPQLWGATGVSFPELTHRLIQLALE